MENKTDKFYSFGAITSSVVIFLTLLDVVIGTALGGDLSMIPQSAVDKFLQLQQNKFLGLYNLDLLNLIVSLFMIPTFIALFFSLKNENPSLVLLSLIIFLIGTTIFIANNSALPFLELSQKYSDTSTENSKILFAAAGEALISKGAHGSYGVFPGFILITLSEFIISFTMLSGKTFNRVTSYFGLSGTTLLFLYLILVTFTPSAKNSAMLLAAPGGLLSLIWMIMYTKTLFKLAKS